MSLRAVRSPLAPKMTMEQGPGGLRSALMLSVAGSSCEIEVFTVTTMAQRADKFNASCNPRLKNCPMLKNCSLDAAIFPKIPASGPGFPGREDESKNCHYSKEGRGGPPGQNRPECARTDGAPGHQGRSRRQISRN